MACFVLSVCLSLSLSLYLNHPCFLCVITDFLTLFHLPYTPERLLSPVFFVPRVRPLTPAQYIAPLLCSSSCKYSKFSTQITRIILLIWPRQGPQPRRATRDLSTVPIKRGSEFIRFPYHNPSAAFITHDGLRGRLLSVDFSEVGNGILLRNCGIFITFCTSSYPRRLKTSINPLKTKRRLLYLKTQSVPHSKHFSTRL